MAFDGVIGYGLPATVAVAAAPALVSVTLVTLSVPSRPLVVNSVPAKVTVWPYSFDRLVASMVSAAGVIWNDELVAPVRPVAVALRV